MPGCLKDLSTTTLLIRERLGYPDAYASLLLYAKKRKNHGETTALYFIVYSLGRIFVESLRLDSLYWGDWRAAQVTGVILMAVGILLFVYFRKKGKPIVKQTA